MKIPILHVCINDADGHFERKKYISGNIFSEMHCGIILGTKLGYIPMEIIIIIIIIIITITIIILKLIIKKTYFIKLFSN